jgi:hypothetical protein
MQGKVLWGEFYWNRVHLWFHLKDPYSSKGGKGVYPKLKFNAKVWWEATSLVKHNNVLKVLFVVD